MHQQHIWQPVRKAESSGSIMVVQAATDYLL